MRGGTLPDASCATQVYCEVPWVQNRLHGLSLFPPQRWGELEVRILQQFGIATDAVIYRVHHRSLAFQARLCGNIRAGLQQFPIGDVRLQSATQFGEVDITSSMVKHVT